jgi:predicted negative regulator of RcsB-dependent stress response
VAQSKVAAGQFEQAASELKIVVEKSKDPALAQVARLRLARLQLQLGRPDEALALLDVSKAGAFAGQVHEVRGDALLAKGDRSGARLAYQAAVNESAGQEQSPAVGELLRLKLQDLSDAEAAVEQPAAASPESK